MIFSNSELLNYTPYANFYLTHPFLDLVSGWMQAGKLRMRWVMKMFINIIGYNFVHRQTANKLTCSGHLQLTFSDLKQVILDQVGLTGYQTVPFSVYIHNLMIIFHLG